MKFKNLLLNCCLFCCTNRNNTKNNNRINEYIKLLKFENEYENQKIYRFMCSLILNSDFDRLEYYSMIDSIRTDNNNNNNNDKINYINVLGLDSYLEYDDNKKILFNLLLYSCKLNIDYDIIKFLLDNGVNINYNVFADIEYFNYLNALYFSVTNLNYRITELLIGYKIHTDITLYNYLVNFIIDKNDDKMLELLLKYKKMNLLLY